MQSLLGLGTQWRGRVGLSHHSGWRYKATLLRYLEWHDQRELPRHPVKNAVLTGLGHTMARQSRLVAPTPLARQMPWRPDSVAMLALTWPSLSRHMHCRDKPVAPCGLARQSQYPGPAPASSPPPSLSFPHSSPTRATVGRRHRPPHPPDPSKSGLLGGSCGKRSPPFPEGIAPIFSSFNRAYL